MVRVYVFLTLLLFLGVVCQDHQHAASSGDHQHADQQPAASFPEGKPECYTVVQDTGKQLRLCNKGGYLVAEPSLENAKNTALADDVNTFYIIICGTLVFFMQAGFALVEAGCVTEKNVANILFKNIMDAGIGAIAFWLVGYGFAYGGDNPFLGTSSNFVMIGTSEKQDYASWFFQWAFASTAATIVSGSVAERTKVSAYFGYSFFISAFVYPVVAHWVWDPAGWLHAANPFLEGSNGMIDFAGSGVVHMVGGFAGLCGAVVAGPRMGRFTQAFDADGRPIVITEHNKLIAALGVMILWVAWYGFNCGSTLVVTGGVSVLAGKVAVTTSLAAASGMITCMTYSKLRNRHFCLLKTLNGVLAGLVSVTAGCATVEPWAACVIGTIGALVYIAAAATLVRLRIDDPVDAAPIHGFCGAWGVLAVGIFSTADNIKMAYGSDILDAVSSGRQFSTQLLGELAIFAWTMVTAGSIFIVCQKTFGVRVEQKVEQIGLDDSEHGGSAYSARVPIMSYPVDKDQKTTATAERADTSPPLNPITEDTPSKHANDSAEPAVEPPKDVAVDVETTSLLVQP